MISLNGVAEKNSIANDVGQLRIRLVWGLKDRITIFLHKIRKPFQGKKSKKNGAMKTTLDFQPGDAVRVRSMDDIKAVLDARSATGGCVFTPEMIGLCGRVFKVYKKVDHFNDEVKAKMCKSRNLFLLEGAFCSGRRRMFPADCDRNCFLFWHALWLEPVAPGASPQTEHIHETA
jgi:hypothetical protein